MTTAHLFENLVAIPVAEYHGQFPPVTSIASVQRHKMLCFAVCVTHDQAHPELNETLLWGMGRKGHAYLDGSWNGSRWDYSPAGSKSQYELPEAFREHTRPRESTLEDVVEFLRYMNDMDASTSVHIIIAELQWTSGSRKKQRTRTPSRSRSSSVMSPSPSPPRTIWRRSPTPSESNSEERVSMITLTLKKVEHVTYGTLPFTLRVKPSTKVEKLVEKVKRRGACGTADNVRFAAARASKHYLDKNKTLGEEGIGGDATLWYHCV